MYVNDLYLIIVMLNTGPKPIIRTAVFILQYQNIIAPHVDYKHRLHAKGGRAGWPLQQVLPSYPDFLTWFSRAAIGR